LPTPRRFPDGKHPCHGARAQYTDHAIGIK
jgi:hypothetical protein